MKLTSLGAMLVMGCLLSTQYSLADSISAPPTPSTARSPFKIPAAPGATLGHNFPALIIGDIDHPNTWPGIYLATQTNTAPITFMSGGGDFNCAWPGGIATTKHDDSLFLGHNRSNPPNPNVYAPSMGLSFEYGYWADQTGDGSCEFQQETYLTNSTNTGTQVTFSGSVVTGTTLTVTDTTHNIQQTVTAVNGDTLDSLTHHLAQAVTENTAFQSHNIYARAWNGSVYLFSRPVITGLTWTAASSLGTPTVAVYAGSEIRPFGMTYDGDLGPDGGGHLNIAFSIGNGPASEFCVAGSDGNCNNAFFLIDPVGRAIKFDPYGFSTPGATPFQFEDHILNGNAVIRFIPNGDSANYYIQVGSGYFNIGSGGSLNLLGAVSFQERVIDYSATIQMQPNDTIADIKTSGGAASVVLPAFPTNGQKATVCDHDFAAATNHITISAGNGSGNGNIDQSATRVISNNGGCWNGHFTDTFWKTDSVY